MEQLGSGSLGKTEGGRKGVWRENGQVQTTDMSEERIPGGVKDAQCMFSSDLSEKATRRCRTKSVIQLMAAVKI